jgi:drug/metabolite transporter (DMT)-like permease
MGKVKWFKTKGVAAVFAGLAFVVGFSFLEGGATGNVILDNHYPIDIMSLIGLLLVLCSAILAVYIIRK